jgi:hypothetical protein
MKDSSKENQYDNPEYVNKGEEKQAHKKKLNKQEFFSFQHSLHVEG